MSIVHKVLFVSNKAILVLFIVVCYFNLAFAQTGLIQTKSIDSQDFYIDFAKATVEEASELIKNYDINQQYSCTTLLSRAIYDVAQNPSETSVEKIKLLIDAGVNVNQGTCTATPLYIAAGFPRLAIMNLNYVANEMLDQIKRGVGYCYHLGKQCKDATAEDMKTLDKVFDDLYYPVQNNASVYTVQVMNLLIENGADINKGNLKDKQSPLFMAATVKNSLNALKTLIEHGADVNHQADNGYTALHVAAAAKNTKAIKMLLDAGADPNIRNHMGQTYLELDENSPVNQAILHSSDRVYFSM